MVLIVLKVYKRIIKIIQKTFSTIYFIQIFRCAKNGRAISPYNSLFLIKLLSLTIKHFLKFATVITKVSV